MKMNEEYIVTCTMDLRRIVDKIYDNYKDLITVDEIEFYQKHMTPSRLHQMMIEIYFFNHIYSSQELALLKDFDWYKMLLIMRYDIMTRLGASKQTIMDCPLALITTANIEETPVGEKVYLKDTKYLKENKTYQILVNRFYSVITDINPDIINRFVVTFANSKYQLVSYEYPESVGQELEINKTELMDQLLSFLLIANTNISLSSAEEDF